jgi:hypothetical protein
LIGVAAGVVAVLAAGLAASGYFVLNSPEFVQSFFSSLVGRNCSVPFHAWPDESIRSGFDEPL